MNIKPISDLRNYNTVLKDCTLDSPVFLTKNGRGRYVIMDAEQYDALMAEIKLMRKILKTEQRVVSGEDYLTLSQLQEKFSTQNSVHTLKEAQSAFNGVAKDLGIDDESQVVNFLKEQSEE
jgi:prevent-host-death family protein